MPLSSNRPLPFTTSGDRRLDEAVVQTAEEAVRMDFHGAEGRRTEDAAAITGMQGFTTGSWDSHEALDDEGLVASAHLARCAGGVSRLVAERPGQSALIAVAAGALAMLVLRAQLRKLRWSVLAKRRP